MRARTKFQSMRRPRLFLFGLVLLIARLVLSEPTPIPTSVAIIDVPTERRNYGTNIGNIKVTFSDGHSEMWTPAGKCMYAKVSSSGLVGWTRYTGRNAHGEPVNDVLRIRYRDRRAKDFRHGPFIEDWGFADDDSAVVIKSRGRHGPARYIKYALLSGKVIESVDIYEPLPRWAQPYAD
ncbi:MAG: hypothetical protein DME34_02850 [Verrucomicrobia bacterium]|nr:MAG: hypothetical protein DME34_02850 [Verrucomicrobiota bacterium]